MDNGVKKAYIFRGSPASGKGTLTAALVKTLKRKTALLELDVFRWRFHYTNRQIKDITHEEHFFAYHNLLLLLESYCKNGEYDLIIEGLFSWDKTCPHGNMQDIITILKRYNFDYQVFLLAADFETLWQRNKNREYVVPKDEFKELFDAVMKEKKSTEIIIDVTNKTPKETLKDIQEHLL